MPFLSGAALPIKILEPPLKNTKQQSWPRFKLALLNPASWAYHASQRRIEKQF